MLCSSNYSSITKGFEFDYPLHFKLKKNTKKKRSKAFEVDEEDFAAATNAPSNNYMKLFSSKYMLKRHGNSQVKVIIGKKQLYEIEWPEKQQSVDITLNQFNNWLNGSQDEKSIGKLSKFPKDKFWAYLSYQRVRELFSSDLKMYDSCMPWEQVFENFTDYSGKTGKDLNLWWGSEGSYTPCHFDSYGFNIVFQVSGSKIWTLFPPSEYHKMYATRVPYEETSVFSQVNIIKPNFDMHPLFAVSTSSSIVLNEGDMLLVPKHWWHYAEAMTDSISVNCWFDLDCDIFDRMKEIVTSIHINMYMNDHKIRDELMLKLFHLSEMAQKQIMQFNLEREGKSPIKKQSQAELDMEFDAFVCTCNQSQPFSKQHHVAKGLNLLPKQPNAYKISKVSKPNQDKQHKRNSQPKQSQSMKRGSKVTTVKEISNFINSICDYSTLDAYIQNLKYQNL